MTIRTMSVAVCTLFVFLLVPASPAQAATHVEIAVDQLNIRSTPGTDNPIIGTLAKGMRLSILAQQKDWTKVKLANGQEGWVHSKYTD
ncbi:SH3 domain-containing protein [Brevibacillus composti]|uniref:SH3 domain-containing protein n=1 Tax=Brevibacillus composti TaxID=2796470 RepID=UPI001E582593|nr:SH3 domain-containing protein [Brevibacillus composti]